MRSSFIAGPCIAQGATGRARPSSLLCSHTTAQRIDLSRVRVPPRCPPSCSNEMEAAVAYLHFLSAFLVAAFLISEFLVCAPGLQATQVRLLARVDVYYLMAAVAVVVTGALRVFAVGKGAGFYLANPVFYIKLALFLAVGLVSIPPTLQFLRWKRGLSMNRQFVPLPADVTTARRYVA